MKVQRTWKHGIKAGLLTGMGSSTADCIGTIVLFMGIRLLLRKGEAAEAPEGAGMVIRKKE